MGMRVASVPSGHPYVQRVTAAPDVVPLPDPPVPGAPPDVWWPPVALDPAWITAHRDAIDILHIHFGTESFRTGHLTSCIRTAQRLGCPVVYTAHDLTHPQLVSQDAYEAQLDELMHEADAIVTLTPGAADEIRRRWRVIAEVIPHPSLLARDAVIPVARTSADIRVGTFLKDLRPNIDGPATVRALLAAVGQLRQAGVPAVAEVRMHHEVRDGAAREEVRRLCAEVENASYLEHARQSDHELAISLSRLDACVLPYGYGTHSGWLELCWDLGVPAAVPDVGYYHEQHRDGSVGVFRPGNAVALASALAALLSHPLATKPGSADRRRLIADRRLVRARTDAAAAASHSDLYRRLLQERAS
jgi:glycosyltransferase involved in cell wall biosynthesis